mgnify:CR=1 FL=1
MPKQEGQKSKLLALLHIFEQQTDEEHLLNVPQLVELLARQGILCERKSVYSDIDALNALGYDCGAVDGIFGAKTYNAVVKFQKDRGLAVDEGEECRLLCGTAGI